MPIRVINRHREYPPPKSDTEEVPEPIKQGNAISPFDLSQLQLVRRQPRAFKDREGYLCYWKYKDNRSPEVTVTFHYRGQHRFVKLYGPVKRVVRMAIR